MSCLYIKPIFISGTKIEAGKRLGFGSLFCYFCHSYDGAYLIRNCLDLRNDHRRICVISGKKQHSFILLKSFFYSNRNLHIRLKIKIRSKCLLAVNHICIILQQFVHLHASKFAYTSNIIMIMAEFHTNFNLRYRLKVTLK